MCTPSSKSLDNIQRKVSLNLVTIPSCCATKRGSPIIAMEGNKSSIVEFEADRISNIPEPIVHKILSLLPIKYATRTSALSKKWEIVWSRYPEVILKEVNHRNPRKSPEHDFIECRQRYIRHMQQELSRRCMKNLNKLQICTSRPGVDKIYDLADGFVDAAMKGCLKELDLKFPHAWHQFDDSESESERGCELCYKLPMIVFSLGLSLVSLRVEGCNLLEFSNLVFRFPLLTLLSMKNTHIEGAFLEQIIGSCPAMESLLLRDCHELHAFIISHGKVKHLVLGGFTEMKNIKIDLPSLQSYKCLGVLMMRDKARLNPSADVFKLLCLNSLTLTFLRIKAETMNLMLSTFLNLRTLKIKYCCSSETIKVSGDSITNLVIKDSEFKDLEIEATNLRVFKFDCGFNCRGNGKSFKFEKMGFKFLQSLCIKRDDALTGNDLEFIISKSPLLVSLKLKSCSNLGHITVSSVSLQHVVIEDCLNVKVLSLLAPQLLFLKYTGPVSIVSELSASKKLAVELFLREKFHDHDENKDMELVIMREFLQKLSSFVKSMILQCYCAECMMMPRDLRVPPPLDFLKFFKVKTHQDSGTSFLDLLNRVLSVSYCYKTVCIDLYFCKIEMEFKEFSDEELLEQLRSPETHDCVKEHLVEVNATYFTGNDDDEIRVVEFLLRKALLLQTMTFTSLRSSNRDSFKERVDNIQKASTNLEIVYT